VLSFVRVIHGVVICEGHVLLVLLTICPIETIVIIQLIIIGIYSIMTFLHLSDSIDAGRVKPAAQTMPLMTRPYKRVPSACRVFACRDFIVWQRQ